MSRVYLGVDLGASYTKACLVDEAGAQLADAVQQTGLSFASAGAQMRESVCRTAGVRPADLARQVSTGVGRDTYEERDLTRTEISCLTRGVHHHFPRSATIVDLGAEDLKLVRIDGTGRELDFKMNRKCAAGTGAFLEDIARKLQVPLTELNAMASRTDRALEVNSYCTVFAGTELVHQLRLGRDLNELTRGVYGALVSRVMSLAGLGTGPLILTGGVVAHHPVFLELMRQRTGLEVLVPPHPQTLTAFGAALYGREGGA